MGGPFFTILETRVLPVSDFRFKHFSVAQEGVAMRVNTDGVLLGAWVRLPVHKDMPKVLDVCTGLFS